MQGPFNEPAAAGEEAPQFTVALNLDGSRAAAARRDSAPTRVAAVSVGGTVWVLRIGGTSIVVRSADHGQIRKRIELGDEGVALAVVAGPAGANSGAQSTVWVAMAQGAIAIYGSEGSLLGSVQAPDGGSPAVSAFFNASLEAGNILFSCGEGKDVTLWDTQRCVKTQHFFGRIAGECVTGIASCDSDSTFFVVSTTHSIRIWSKDQAVVAAAQEDAGASTVAVDYSFQPFLYVPSTDVEGTMDARVPSQGMTVCYIWAARRAVVTVMAVVVTAPPDERGIPTMVLVPHKTLPCPRVRQMLRTGPRRMALLDVSGLVTSWSTTDYGPLRTLKLHDGDDADVIADGDVAILSVPTVTAIARRVWTFGKSDKAILWSDESVVNPSDMDWRAVEAAVQGHYPTGPGSLDAAAQETIAASRQADSATRSVELQEIAFLRRKVTSIEAMGSLLQKKVSELINDPASRFKELCGPYREIHNAYDAAMKKCAQQTLIDEPMPNFRRAANGSAALLDASGLPNGMTEPDSTAYWKDRYIETLTQMERQQAENELAIEYFLAKVGRGAIPPPNSRGDGGVLTPTSGPRGSRRGNTSRSGISDSMGPNALAVSAEEDVETDVKRAQLVCQLIKDKNAAEARARRVSEEMVQLRKRLRGSGSALASAPGTFEDADVSTENMRLTTTVRDLQRHTSELEADLTAAQQVAQQVPPLKEKALELQHEVTAVQATCNDKLSLMQASLQQMVDKMEDLRAERTAANEKLLAAECSLRDAGLVSLQRDKHLAHLERQLGETDARVDMQRVAEERVMVRLKDEIRELCNGLDDRDATIAKWQARFEDASRFQKKAETEAHEQRLLLDAREREVEGLTERVASLESIIQDRRRYAALLSELQGRLENATDFFRSVAVPCSITAPLERLEDRVAGLVCVDSQLKQKEDAIAVLQDELAVMRENASAVEKHVTQISTVFAQLPHTVEEVEDMLIELEEYRKEVPPDDSFRAAVRRRQLDVYAQKRLGREVVLGRDSPVLDDAEAEERREERRRVRELEQAALARGVEMAVDFRASASVPSCAVDGLAAVTGHRTTTRTTGPGE